MPKMKTHKTAARRFHISGSGKIMHSKIGGSHLRRNKPARVKREYHGSREISPTMAKRVKTLLPYR